LNFGSCFAKYFGGVRVAMTNDELILELEKKTVVEVNQLVKALEERWGVSAAAPMAMAVAAGPAAVAEEKTDFTVHLVSSGEKKIGVIKVVRELTGLGLKEAKDLVDGAPANIKEGVPKKDAEDWKKKIEEVGGKIELK
jgi:large subunit ribosomal protein L7/L12